MHTSSNPPKNPTKLHCETYYFAVVVFLYGKMLPIIQHMTVLIIKITVKHIYLDTHTKASMEGHPNEQISGDHRIRGAARTKFN